MAQGLKARKADDDGEEYEGLERVMEYAGVVGAELADMLTAVHEKVKAIEPRVPAQHTFGGDGLQNFIRDHQALGAEGVIPSKQIKSFLRDFKQFTHNIPSGKIVGF